MSVGLLNTLNIAVCDDEPEQSEYLRRLVAQWADARGKRVVTRLFQSAEALLFAAEDIPVTDIFLLDIQMPGMDGVTLARRLRADGGEAQLVFITGYDDWISEGYEVDALHYLMKPVDRQKLFAVLDKAAERAAKQERYILLNIDGDARRVAAGRIIYAEAFSHYVELRIKDGAKDKALRQKITIGEMETLLGEGFFRCHRSYIAGLRYVTAVSRASVKLENGVELPLSRKLYNAANEAFIKFNRG
ncbi:MAG: LytTR family DNA-binding domain-containing protein [Oscillospiraceae bacterium]|jgi:DNA-binding LytR/AlgR family response regulator|nr:LytTR family DNA-binding domain-containing protein [Oscillospiraceae bacterium]